MQRRTRALLTGLVLALCASGEVCAQVYPRPIPRRMKIPRTPYPEALWPAPPVLLPQGFTMTRIWQAQSAPPQRVRLDKPREVADRLSSCWNPPAAPVAQDITVRLAFARTGAPIGEPRITYVGATLNEQHRDALRASILKAISDCAPLRFTPGLASAIAGRPFAIRFIAPAQKPSGPSIQEPICPNKVRHLRLKPRRGTL